MRGLGLTVAAGLALLGGASPLFADPPAVIPVQGRLTLPGGQPRTAPATLTLRVHSAGTGGSVLHAETDVVSPDAAGAFTTYLGDDLALDPALFDSPRWLTLEVDGDGETSPRLPFTPAPAAIEAWAAEGLTPDADVALGAVRVRGLPAPSGASDAASRGWVESQDNALAAALAAHTTDAALHFTQASIVLPASQISDLDAAVTASAHAADGGVHFTQASLSLATTQVVDLDAAVTGSTHAAQGGVHFPMSVIALDASQVTGLDAAISASTHALDSGNPHAVTSTQLGFVNLVDRKDQLAGSALPSSSDDTSAGYSVGSRWIAPESQVASVLVTESGPGTARWAVQVSGVTMVRVAPVLSGGVPDPLASGAALEAALAGITGASDSQRYLLKIAPGTYQLSGALALKDHVWVRGSGMRATRILVSGQVDTSTLNHVRDLTLIADPSSDRTLNLQAGEALFLERVAIEGLGLTGSSHDAIRSAGASAAVTMEGCAITLATTTSGLLARGVAFTETTVGTSIDVRDSRIEISTPGGGAGLDLGLGRLVLRDSRIDLDLGGVGSGVDATRPGNTQVEVSRSEVTVVSSAGAGTVRGVDLDGDDCRIRGNRLEVAGPVAYGAVDDCTVSEFQDNRVLVTSTSGTAQGTEHNASGSDRHLVSGNTVHVVAVGSGKGLEVGGDASVTSGNTVTVTATSGTGTLVGIEDLSQTTANLSGNEVRVESAVGGRQLKGLDTSGTLAAVTGNTVDVIRTAGATGSSYGYFASSGGTASGNQITVVNTGDLTRGIQCGDANGLAIGGGEVRVTGLADTVGIDGTALRMGNSRVEVAGDGAGVIGIEVSISLTAAGVRVEVDNASATDDAIGLDCPGNGGCVVSSSWVNVTDGGSGTAYVVDPVDDTGSPDARIDGCRNLGEAQGADVTCTDSKCF